MEPNSDIELRGYYLSVRNFIESAIKNDLKKIEDYAKRTKNDSVKEICGWIESPDWETCPYFRVKPHSDIDPRCFQSLPLENFDFLWYQENAVLQCPYGKAYIWRAGALWGLLEEALRGSSPSETGSHSTDLTEHQNISHETLLDVWHHLKTWNSIYLLANQDYGDDADFIHAHLDNALTGVVWPQIARSLGGGRKTAEKAKPTRDEILSLARNIDPEQKRSANDLSETLALELRITKRIPDPQNKGAFLSIYQTRKGFSKSNIRKILLEEGWPNRKI